MKVKMKFHEHKYYNDLNTPMFYAGEVYELEGADWIFRWQKRGGVIVEGPVEEKSKEEAKTYREHMSDWESKADKEKVVVQGEKSEDVLEMPEEVKLETKSKGNSKNKKK